MRSLSPLEAAQQLEQRAMAAIGVRDGDEGTDEVAVYLVGDVSQMVRTVVADRLQLADMDEFLETVVPGLVRAFFAGLGPEILQHLQIRPRDDGEGYHVGLTLSDRLWRSMYGTIGQWVGLGTMIRRQGDEDAPEAV